MQTKIEQSAKRYAKQKYLLAAINIAVGLAFLVFMSASGGFASMYLKNLLSLLTTNESLLIALYLTA
ncbi:MAG: hypothetical protein HYW14_00750, partial [Planctomycetes bacterium]|nr:hypothetical protein [Planctomycetota bacterium]